MDVLPGFQRDEEIHRRHGGEKFRDDPRRPGRRNICSTSRPHYVQASGKFATLLYKEEIEVLLRTPGYAGFSLARLARLPDARHGAGRAARSVLGLERFHHAGSLPPVLRADGAAAADAETDLRDRRTVSRRRRTSRITALPTCRARSRCGPSRTSRGARWRRANCRL